MSEPDITKRRYTICFADKINEDFVSSTDKLLSPVSFLQFFPLLRYFMRPTNFLFLLFYMLNERLLVFLNSLFNSFSLFKMKERMSSDESRVNFLLSSFSTPTFTGCSDATVTNYCKFLFSKVKIYHILFAVESFWYWRIYFYKSLQHS